MRLVHRRQYDLDNDEAPAGVDDPADVIEDLARTLVIPIVQMANAVRAGRTT